MMEQIQRGPGNGAWRAERAEGENGNHMGAMADGSEQKEGREGDQQMWEFYRPPKEGLYRVGALDCFSGASRPAGRPAFLRNVGHSKCKDRRVLRNG